MIQIKLNKNTFKIEDKIWCSDWIRLSLKNIYSIEPIIKEIQKQSRHKKPVVFSSSEKRNDYLALELLLHAIYLNLVYYVYPKINTKAPNKAEYARQNFEHELNSLKNLPHFESLCNCQILKDFGSNTMELLPI